MRDVAARDGADARGPGRFSALILCHDAAMASVTPILLVHGAWHGAWCWSALQAELDRRGIPSQAMDLPGHGVSTAPLADMYTDAQHVADILARVGDAPVLVGHSYGGAVITEAAVRAPGRVAHLVYLAAFALDEGETVMTAANTSPPPDTALAAAMTVLDDGTAVLRNPQTAAAALYGCCPPAVVAAAFPRLSPQPLATFGQPVTGSPRGAIPSTYVRCLRDQAVAPAHQAVMAGRCDTAIDFDTDHSPFLSMVTETADVLERISRA